MITVQFRGAVLKAIDLLNNDRDFIFTFERLRFLLIEFHEELNDVEMNTVLDLFIYGLENSNVTSENVWKNEVSYLNGNITMAGWTGAFTKENLNLNFLVNFLEQIKVTKVDFPNEVFQFDLRNAEVTLRDHVTFNNKNVYKEVIEGTLRDILKGEYRKGA